MIARTKVAMDFTWWPCVQGSSSLIYSSRRVGLISVVCTTTRSHKPLTCADTLIYGKCPDIRRIAMFLQFQFFDTRLPETNNKGPGEPPRVSRRLQFLRGWSHENNNEIF